MQEAERHGGPTRLGSYEIVRPLARGGMAELFLARVAGPQTFEKLVVVKKILPKFADHPRFVQLFLDEAQLAASLSHKNIVAVHDIGGSGSDCFFAMEYLHGQDVRSILHRAWRDGEKLPITHAVQIGSQIASALHYAHEKRRPDGTLLEIVHRDVSPSNVIVSYDGKVKLVDFGVAKAATRTVKTRTGTLKGKIAYMSPEQAKGAAIDRRSDVFSLGIVLWEMVTVSRLFRGENDLATLQLIINMPIKKPTEERPDCPVELERIILKALAQDVTKRYQTANEVVQDLEDLVRREQLSQSSASLSVYMSGLFRAELQSWELARASGVALGEHLTNVGDVTTPVSESEFIEPIDSIDLEEEEDEDPADSLGAVSGTIEPVPGRRAPTPAAGTIPPRTTGGIPAAIPGGAASGPVVARTASGPVPQATTAAIPQGAPAVARTASGPIPHGPTQQPVPHGAPAVARTASGPIPQPTTAAPSGPIPQAPPPTPPRPSAVMRTETTPPATQSARAPRADATEHVTPLPRPTAEERGRDLTPVPQRTGPEPSPWPTGPTPDGGLAHGSWPQSAQTVAMGGSNAESDALFSFEQAQLLRKRFVQAGIALVAIIFLIALVKACGGSGGGDTKQDDPPTEGSAVVAPTEGSAAVPPTEGSAVVTPTEGSAVAPNTSKPPPVDEPVAVDAGIAAVPIDAAAEVPVVKPPVAKPPVVKPPVVKKPPIKQPPTVKKPPIKKFDPNAPLPPR